MILSGSHSVFLPFAVTVTCSGQTAYSRQQDCFMCSLNMMGRLLLDAVIELCSITVF